MRYLFTTIFLILSALLSGCAPPSDEKAPVAQKDPAADSASVWVSRLPDFCDPASHPALPRGTVLMTDVTQMATWYHGSLDMTLFGPAAVWTSGRELQILWFADRTRDLGYAQTAKKSFWRLYNPPTPPIAASFSVLDAEGPDTHTFSVPLKRIAGFGPINEGEAGTHQGIMLSGSLGSLSFSPCAGQAQDWQRFSARLHQ